MIKVLVVDDRAEKVADIRKVLVERCSVDDDNIDEAKSVSSGLKALKAKFYDLVLLDLLLPQFDSDENAQNPFAEYQKAHRGRAGIARCLRHAR